MPVRSAQLERLRFYSNVIVIYTLTLLFAWSVLRPAPPAQALSGPQRPFVPVAPRIKLIAGRPVRIVIPASGVDLPVDEGYYDSTSNSWTLSGYHAQFAMVSTLANNVSGDTFIYGHNNNYVFGALRHVTPTPGATALLYTDNGHIFAYSFQSVTSVGPDDTTVLDYSGPPVMTIQTCTGSLNEWRTMYRFSFTKVVQ